MMKCGIYTNTGMSHSGRKTAVPTFKYRQNQTEKSLPPVITLKLFPLAPRIRGTSTSCINVQLLSPHRDRPLHLPRVKYQTQSPSSHLHQPPCSWSISMAATLIMIQVTLFFSFFCRKK